MSSQKSEVLNVLFHLYLGHTDELIVFSIQRPLPVLFMRSAHYDTLIESPLFSVKSNASGVFVIHNRTIFS